MVMLMPSSCSSRCRLLFVIFEAQDTFPQSAKDALQKKETQDLEALGFLMGHQNNQGGCPLELLV
jgi:hypothetical protein